MVLSYKKLWKLLIDKDMMKKDLTTAAGISNFTVSKMSRGEPVSGEVMLKICTALNCNIGDIVDAVPDGENTTGSGSEGKL
jgi:DNA-binding Xre family transcriptional regulator